MIFIFRDILLERRGRREILDNISYSSLRQGYSLIFIFRDILLERRGRQEILDNISYSSLRHGYSLIFIFRDILLERRGRQEILDILLLTETGILIDISETMKNLEIRFHRSKR